MLVGFVIRLIGYAVLLGVTSRVAEALWLRDGLDGVRRLQHFHDLGLTGLLIAPVVLALFGFGRLRDVAVFCGFFLAGAALTAPFVCARVAGLPL